MGPAADAVTNSETAAIRETATHEDGESSARERILAAAGELFAESGFDATPTSRIAERARVPKGLIHYYFQRKQDLLVALVELLPDDTIDTDEVVVPGDVAASVGRLVRELDTRLASSLLLSHLLWREADTHESVRTALQSRFEHVVTHIRRVIETALPQPAAGRDVRTASMLLARVVQYRHSMARHHESTDELDREIDFVARALAVS